MNILVAGGAGFVGSHLVRHLLPLPHVKRVTVYDDFTSGTWDHLKPLLNNPKLIVIKNDIKNFYALKQAMKDMDAVFHLASNPDISKAAKEPTVDFWEGTFLTQYVLEAARLNGVREILYMSGSGVYSESATANLSGAMEEAEKLPISTYGASKLAGEALISSYCHMFGMRGRALRCANIVGARQTHGVGFDFIRKLKARSKLEILGDGTQTKSYVDVADVVRAMFCTLTISFDIPFAVFNVAGDDTITVTEIAHLAYEIMNIKEYELSYTGGNRGWKGDVPLVRLNSSKLRSLGWSPTRNSREALAYAMAAMRDNKIQ